MSSITPRSARSTRADLTTKLIPAPNPSGMCFCGCGKTTPLATATSLPNRIKGQHTRFCHGHGRKTRPKGCMVGGCARPHHSRGYCSAHAMRVKTHGDPLASVPIPAPKTPRRRLMDNVVFETGTWCWLWTGWVAGNGYGRLGWKGGSVAAHRLAYQLYRGEIDDGLVIDHLCRNRRCVNPSHLEPVTQGENVKRGYQAKAAEVAALQRRVAELEATLGQGA